MVDDGRMELSEDGGVAHLRLSRPDVGNAIDRAWVDRFDDAVAALEQADGIRALLISAEGQAFSRGGDLHHFAACLDRLDGELSDMVGRYHADLARLAELPVPVVCAVQGAAAGGALGLLWCSDVVIAGDDARLACGFADLGLSGDGGSSWFLPRLVGLRRAREMILLRRVLTAAEALDWGLVTKVVPAAEVEAEAWDEVHRLAAGPTVAYGEIRRLLGGSFARTLPEQLSAERDAIVRCGATGDAREGIAAFVERRPPSFKGG
jgi:2-(1,2-epoxy-1,2-dihydrophenyl)acetyl-CoA isomerase